MASKKKAKPTSKKSNKRKKNAPVSKSKSAKTASTKSEKKITREEDEHRPGDVLEANDPEPSHDAPAPAADTRSPNPESDLSEIEELRPHWLFRVSGFVLVIFSVFLVFGGFWMARTYLPMQTIGLIKAHNDLVLRSILFGLLFIETALLFKLYAVLIVLKSKEAVAGYQESNEEWFLRISTIAFTLLAGAVIIRGFLETNLLSYALPNETKFVLWYTGVYGRKCILSGLFFLSFAIFTLLYLVATKIVRGTEFEQDF